MAKKKLNKKKPKSKLGSEFLKDVFSWLEENHPNIDKYREPGLHASSLWKTCGRREVLIAKEGVKQRSAKRKAGSFMTTDEGHILHDLWQDTYLSGWGGLKGHWYCRACDRTMAGIILKPDVCCYCGRSSEYLSYREVRVNLDDLSVVGHADGIVLFKGLDRVFELKTKSVEQFKLIHHPLHDHVIQVHAYMRGLGLNSALIVYIQKGKMAKWRRPKGYWECCGATAKCYLVEWDDEVWDRIKEMVFHHHRAKKEIEEGDFSPLESYPMTCSSKNYDLARECPVRDICFDKGPVIEV